MIRCKFQSEKIGEISFCWSRNVEKSKSISEHEWDGLTKLVDCIDLKLFKIRIVIDMNVKNSNLVFA